MWEPKHFPPSDDIEPLLISMHFGNEIRNRKFFKSSTCRYLNEHGPVGCRDLDSLSFLKSLSNDAYFSGCLTTTLLSNESLKNNKTNEYVLCVDLPDELVDYIKKHSHYKVYCVSNLITRMLSASGRFEVAKYMLYLYHNANLVITTRLHAALPSVLFGVPTRQKNQQL